ncbi:hypothetical protein J2T09_005554 [Neorhizobium huautlense]|uniref:Uncharacterized protein n=1 Tax=Neorhizobium huautlense TaxID=67774 RepID=A0ABT9Q223_9HYPH|nr:hypothetical protein [Neorhizobium huautlense]MDP9840766.1 hypothetical protein [Neorhizobium huautlense]
MTVQEASGWYLHGDVGDSFNKIRGAKFFQGGAADSEGDFASTDIKDSFLRLGSTQIEAEPERKPAHQRA